MATIVTRAGKGAPLTNAELDANFTNLNTDKVDVANLGTGVATWLGTPSSANLAAAVTDETGTGALVFATSPTLGGTVVDNTTNLVTNANIGTDPDELPLNATLGALAYQSPESVIIKPQASAVPAGLGNMVFQLTSDTSLEIKVKGLDGTVRTTSLTLA